DTSGDPSFGELLERVRRWDLAAYAHQDLPFDRLVEELQPARSLARHPLFQIMLSWTETEPEPLSLTGLEITPEPAALSTVKFDLEIGFTPHPDHTGLTLHLGYATDLFDETTVRALGEALVRVLSAVAADPGIRLSALPVVSPAQRDMLTAWGSGPEASGAGTVTGGFARMVRSGPGAVAVVDGDRSLTYRELDVLSDRVAYRLLAAGVAPETPVPVLMERGAALVVALVGVMKAGAAYLPLHLAHPAPRMAETTEGNTSPVLLIDPAHADHPYTTSEQSTRHVITVTTDDDTGFTDNEIVLPTVLSGQLAYVMFTSGSTGRPKGIAVTHQSVTDLARDPAWNVTAKDRVLFQAPHAFDGSVYELWTPLLTGAAIVIAPPGRIIDAPALRSLTERHGITHVSLTAGLFRVIAETDPGAFTGLTEVTTGGDVIPPDAVR
ncbi:AMP-binding protein, partial [Streptomyces inusitatus]|uniref:AMP-binding protein n=1 Tax=Streptomyces inusitatus TaxID=68221 RepID=UPI00167D3BBE